MPTSRGMSPAPTGDTLSDGYELVDDPDKPVFEAPDASTGPIPVPRPVVAPADLMSQPPAAAPATATPVAIDDNDEDSVALDDNVETSVAPATMFGLHKALAIVHMLLVALAVGIGALAALLASKTVGLLLALTPLADDKWGLKATAAAMRVGLHTLALLGSAPTNLTAGLAGAARLCTSVAVEFAVLFSQPLFVTVAGGVFKAGDTAKATILRLSRTAWLSVDSLAPSGLLLLIAALMLWPLDKLQLPSKKFRNGYPRAVVALVGKGARAVAVAALFHRFRTATLEYFTALPIGTALSSLPELLFISRQEFCLFRWSFDSSVPLALLVVGDLLASSPSAPPTWGAVGAILVGVALWLTGIEPTMGYVVHTTAWLAHAACDLTLNWLGVLAPAYVIASPLGAVKYEQSAKCEPASAKLLVRVGGWRQPILRPFDDVVRYCVLIALLLAKPSWALYAAGEVWAGAAHTAGMLYRAVIGA